MAERKPSTSGNDPEKGPTLVCRHCDSPIAQGMSPEEGVFCPGCNSNSESASATPKTNSEPASATPKNVLPSRRQSAIRPKFEPKQLNENSVAVAESDWGSGSETGLRTNPIHAILRRQRWRWLAIGGIFTGCGAVMVYVMFHFVGSTSGPVAVSDTPVPLPLSMEVVQPEEIVEAFLSPGLNVDERIALLRKTQTAGVKAEDVEAYQADFESGVDWADAFHQAQMLDLGIHGFYVHFRSGAERFVCAVEESGTLGIDWDAFVRTGTSTWDDILEGNAKEAEVRVFVVPGTYYNYDFSDPDTDSAFLLLSPDCDKDLFGYVKRNSRTERVIAHAIAEALNSGSPTPALMTLRLEAVGNSYENRQFRIAHVVASSWVASSFGTVEDLWVDYGSDFEAPLEEMRNLGGRIEASVFYQQGISIQLSDAQGAERYFRRALELQEDFTKARLALGAILASQNDLEAAEVELLQVLQEEETNAEAHYQLGICAAKRGELDTALEHFESTILQNRFHVLAINNVAWLLATHNDPARRTHPRVVELAEKAAKLTRHANASVLATLAVAYGAVSRFEDASKMTSQAIAFLEESGTEPDLKAALRERLKTFEHGKPYLP